VNEQLSGGTSGHHSGDSSAATVTLVLEQILQGASQNAISVRRFDAADAWLVHLEGVPLVLKRGRSEQTDEDVEWEHRLLRDLAESGFPVPRPVSTFTGRSWVSTKGRIWATLGYLPGRSLASEAAPDMHAAGAFLAKYHEAARLLSARPQRPTSGWLDQLRAVTPLGAVRQALGTDQEMCLFMDLLSDLESNLAMTDYASAKHVAVHGDATNDNLIVAGEPPGIVGLIDFGGAHIAPWPTDIANALWRSGRDRDADLGLSIDRVVRFVAGFCGTRPPASDLARTIPVLIQARGLQLVSRRVRRLQQNPHGGPVPDVNLALRRAAWVHQNRSRLEEAIGTVVGGGIACPPDTRHCG
jgi:Ser/Thr protein kinase RdoA (MazF antagonist)